MMDTRILAAIAVVPFVASFVGLFFRTWRWKVVKWWFLLWGGLVLLIVLGSMDPSYSRVLVYPWFGSLFAVPAWWIYRALAARSERVL
jgi:hypothetical protein